VNQARDGMHQLPTSGSVVDGLAIGERIHTSGMGSVYRATAGPGHAPLAFAAVVKTPRAGRGEGADGLLGFQTETRVLPALSGPHVPRFVAAGDLATTPYLAMEWIEGESLAARIERGRVPFEEAARIGAAVADALHSIHRQGAIHLDLKPENIIVRLSGEAVLIDFGLAYHWRFPDLLAEEKRFAGGSAPYVSPEQVLGCRTDPRSDLFALGVVLYEMTTGRLPFGVPRTIAGLRDRLWLDPVPPRLLEPALPQWFQEVILRCMEPDAARRYQSAAHVAFDLRRPDQIPLTARARKRAQAGLLDQGRRWWLARTRQVEAGAAKGRKSAPVIMLAVDTMHPDDLRHPELRMATARLLATSEEFRLICVSVVRAGPLVADRAEDSGSTPGVHMEHLIRLRQWIAPLNLAETRLSLHVIEALNPSETLLEFADSNNVDLIIIGARNPDHHPLAWWRSVASGVTARAHCSVYVVRLPEQED
jgi:nucleotide-binding universal stress UspA family protein